MVANHDINKYSVSWQLGCVLVEFVVVVDDDVLIHIRDFIGLSLSLSYSLVALPIFCFISSFSSSAAFNRPWARLDLVLFP